LRFAFRDFAVSLLVGACALALAAPASAASAEALTWGENEVGQLGNATTLGTDAPSAVGGLGEVASLAGGGRHGLALLGDGTVAAWGENDWGQLGDGTHTGPESCHAAYAGASEYAVACSLKPIPVSGLSGVLAIAAGAQHSLALLSDGTVMAWGDNEVGQLGDGSVIGPEHCYKEDEPTQCSTRPIPVSGLSEATAIAAGQNYSLALLKNGTVMAWGSDVSEEPAASWSHDEPTPVANLSGVIAIAAGGDGETSLALLSNGTVMAWGANEFGELGDGTLAGSDVPVAVSGLSEIRAIAIGGGAGLALRDNGTVMSWGSNISGQLGIGTFTGPTECFLYNFCSSTPVAVSDLEHATAIAAGGGQGLARLGDGTVMAWGLNWHGQLGIGTRESSDVPVPVYGLTEASAIAGGDDFSLAYGVLGSPPEAAPPSEEGPPETPAGKSSGAPAGSIQASSVAVKPIFPNLAEMSELERQRARELAAALRACRRKPMRMRAICERRARKKYRRPASTSKR
jgi:alpha-tubulin suppressor-like RCC1 family protein